MAEQPRTMRCGGFVRKARRRHGIGQAELAARLGTHQPAISRIERDQVTPTVDMLARIFEAMGEAIFITPVSLSDPPPGGPNQSTAELRAQFNETTVEERLEQAAKLSEIATELAAGASA